MITQQLVTFIQSQLQNGKSKETIKTLLLTEGWQDSDIESAFQTVSPPAAPIAQPQPAKPSHPNNKIAYIALTGIFLVCIAGGYFLFVSYTNKERPPTRPLPNTGTVPVTPVATTAISQVSPTFAHFPINTPTPIPVPTVPPGWQKAMFFPSAAEHGISFYFSYPTPSLGFMPQRINQQLPPTSIDAVNQIMNVNNSIINDLVVQMSSEGTKTFDDYVREATPFADKPQTITDFTTSEGLTGKRITAEGKLDDFPAFFDVILLHTGKQSDLGFEMIIRAYGIYSYGGGRGHGKYTGNSDMIDSIAKTISLQ